MNADNADNKRKKHLRLSACICGQNEKSEIGILRSLLAEAPAGPCKERTARYLHARLTGELVRSGAAVTLDYKDVVQLLRENFEATGGHWSICRTKKPTQ